MGFLTLILATLAVFVLLTAVGIIIILSVVRNKAKNHHPNVQSDYTPNYQADINANIQFNTNANYQPNNNQANNGVKFCVNCGSQNPIHQNFCGNCGAVLSNNAQQSQNYQQ